MKKKLTYLFLKLDYRDNDKSSIKKLIGILAGYLVANSLISMNFFLTFDYLSFAILSFTVNVFLLSFIVLNDFHNLFFAKKHIDILKVMPLQGEEIFLSKIASAFIYLSLIISASIVPQTIFFYFFEYSVIKSLIFTFENYLFAISSVTVILIIFSLIVLKIPGKSNFFIYIFQFGFLAYVMYSSSLAARAKFRNSQSIFNFSFVNYLPQKYFALSVDNSLYLILSVSSVLIILAVFYFFMKKNYIKMSNIIFSLEDRKRKKHPLKIFSGFHNIIENIFLKNNFERASYNLTRNQFRNSRTFKIRYVPLTFIPLVFCLIGVFVETNKYLIFSESVKDALLTGGFIILSPSIIITFIMCSRLMITNTKIADENSENSEWIYDILPIENKKLFFKGTQKFIYINLLIPVLLCSIAILSFKISFLPLVLNMLYIASSMFFINALFLLFDKRYPFSQKSSKYNSANRLLEVLITSLIGVVLFIAQIFIFQNIVFIIIAIILIFGAAILISLK